MPHLILFKDAGHRECLSVLYVPLVHGTALTANDFASARKAHTAPELEMCAYPDQCMSGRRISYALYLILVFRAKFW